MSCKSTATNSNDDYPSVTNFFTSNKSKDHQDFSGKNKFIQNKLNQAGEFEYRARSN